MQPDGSRLGQVDLSRGELFYADQPAAGVAGHEAAILERIAPLRESGNTVRIGRRTIEIAPTRRIDCLQRLYLFRVTEGISADTDSRTLDRFPIFVDELDREWLLRLLLVGLVVLVGGN